MDSAFDRVRYACQAEDDLIVFVDDLSPEDNMAGHRLQTSPSDDFALACILDANDEVVTWHVDKQGRWLAPARELTWKQLSKIRRPENMETITGRLENLEELLAKS
jgi:hypothetical protein